MQLKELDRRIQSREALIGVIGLGYVGLPVAATFANIGFEVIGIDLQKERVETINLGMNPIEGIEPGLDELLAEVVANGRLRATTDYTSLSRADVVLIAVETPVDDDHRPRYLALQTACQQLVEVLRPGVLVIVESTIAPGTIDNVVRPLLEQESGLRVNQDFYLGACPERVMPGKLLANLRNMNRVCGGSTPETSAVMVTLYRQIVEADLDMADPVTAELVKTTENAYRDVQIAFANEVALICEAVGADVWQVRKLVNKVPYRQMHMPGAGVGGHCIPKDAWLLAHGAGSRIPIRLIPQARDINDSMPLHVAKLTLAALREAGLDPTVARVAILGYAYLENSDDTRNSPSQALVSQLQGDCAEIVIHDPWVEGLGGELIEKIKGCDAIVIMVAHDEYRRLDLEKLKSILRTPIVIDGRHVVDMNEALAAGFVYRGVGIAVQGGIQEA